MKQRSESIRIKEEKIRKEKEFKKKVDEILYRRSKEKTTYKKKEIVSILEEAAEEVFGDELKEIHTINGYSCTIEIDETEVGSFSNFKLVEDKNR